MGILNLWSNCLFIVCYCWVLLLYFWCNSSATTERLLGCLWLDLSVYPLLLLTTSNVCYFVFVGRTQQNSSSRFAICNRWQANCCCELCCDSAEWQQHMMTLKSRRGLSGTLVLYKETSFLIVGKTCIYKFKYIIQNKKNVIKAYSK